MKLYHLSALPPTSKRLILEGSFTAPRQQELITATAGSLELYRLQPKRTKLSPLFRADCFANVINLTTFRLPATKRDFLIITSDAGTLTILAADESTNSFRTIHCETLGKTGMRRVVPGQFLASDPRGRACMVSAVEKTKLCFVLNRDKEENLTISSALEANKSNTATLALSAVDVGFENPVFAALEQSYEYGASKQLTYYELDLGLNHVSRKASVLAGDSTFAIITVPGHQDGPGGVLLVADDHITYLNLLADGRRTRKLACRLPHQEGTDPQSAIIVTSTMYHDKKRKAFFFMMCTEKGDLIKADVQWNHIEGATRLCLAYFDSIPAPATNMSIFRAGFLFVAMEGSDAALFRFENVEIPEDDPAGGFAACLSSKHEEIANQSSHAEILDEEGKAQGSAAKLEFRPRAKLKNLSFVETHLTFDALLDIHATRDTLGRPLLLTASGRGKGANLSFLRRGIALDDVSSHVRLPFLADELFTFRGHVESKHHSFVMVSSTTQTMVLQLQDGTIQESPDTGFELAKATVYAGLMSTCSFVQVHTAGVRFIPNGSIDEAAEWKPPANLDISAGSGNSSQLVVVLSSGTLVYFEIDDQSGRLMEVDQQKDVLGMNNKCNGTQEKSTSRSRRPLISIQETPPGRLKASFFAAANSVSNNVRLFRIRPSGSLEALGLQIAPSSVSSIVLVDFGSIADPRERTRSGNSGASQKQKVSDRGSRLGYEPMICLIMGTSSGVLTRAMVDSKTGDLSGKKTTFLGLGSLRTVAFRVGEVPISLVFGSQSLLLRKQGGIVSTMPLLAAPINHAAAISSPSLSNGMIGIAGASLRIMTFDSSEMFSASAARMSSIPSPLLPSKLNLELNYNLGRVPLLSTPRRILPLVMKPASTHLGDGGRELRNGCGLHAYVLLETKRTDVASLRQTENEPQDPKNPLWKRGYHKAERPSLLMSWHSTIEVFAGDRHREHLKESTPELSSKTSYMENELKRVESVALRESACILDGTSTTFGIDNNSGPIHYIIVSVARRPAVAKPSEERNHYERSSGSLLTYSLDPTTYKISLVHITNLPKPAHAITSFRDLIAVGSGNSLEIFSLGRKKLLRKSEYRNIVPNKIVAMAPAGSDRLFVGDVRESVTVLKYTPHLRNDSQEDLHQHKGGKLVALGTDSIPRWITSMVALDYNSVVCGDKFGSIFVLRLAKHGSAVSTRDSKDEGLAHINPATFVGIEDNKLAVQACFHVGSTVTGLTLGSFRMRPIRTKDTLERFDEAIVFATIDGSVGMLVPLARESDIRLASSVENVLRKLKLSLCGRDHVSFRSSFGPVKNVIDGDLCEMFDTLTWEKQAECAQEIGCPVKEIVHKLEELRWSVI